MEDWLLSYSILLKNNYNYENILKRINKRKYYIPIIASRGCTNRCSFCYRHVRGIRRHTVDYVVKHIKFIKNNYNIEGFQFCDELFNSDMEWVSEFCDAIEKENINIFIWLMVPG